METERKITAAEARELFAQRMASRWSTIWPTGLYPMPNRLRRPDEVFIGRIREDISCDNGLAFWCVSDNLRKGAATNAVQIAELLVKSGQLA